VSIPWLGLPTAAWGLQHTRTPAPPRPKQAGPCRGLSPPQTTPPFPLHRTSLNPGIRYFRRRRLPTLTSFLGSHPSFLLHPRTTHPLLPCLCPLPSSSPSTPTHFLIRSYLNLPICRYCILLLTFSSLSLDGRCPATFGRHSLPSSTGIAEKSISQYSTSRTPPATSSIAITTVFLFRPHTGRPDLRRPIHAPQPLQLLPPLEFSVDKLVDEESAFRKRHLFPRSSSSR
jgi:hypothetical protein